MRSVETFCAKVTLVGFAFKGPPQTANHRYQLTPMGSQRGGSRWYKECCKYGYKMTPFPEGGQSPK